MRDLLFKGKRHYNEFLEGGEKVSTSVLRDKLRLLEEGGLITKGDDPVKKSRIRYSLTEKGISLVPMMVEMIVWSAEFDQETAADADFVEHGKYKRGSLITEIQENLRAEHL